MKSLFLLLVICLLGGVTAISAEEAHPLSFQQLLRPKGVLRGDISHLESELSAYHQKEVTIRGFLYQGEEGNWVIASEPSLRSCCVGAKGKMAQQIVLKDEVIGEKQQRAVTLQGRFYVDPIWNIDGSFKQLYRLDHAIILPELPYAWTNVVILLGIVCAICAVYLWWKR